MVALIHDKVFCAQDITKKFPGVIALQNVNFTLAPGEIHSICGENGAGKSTLIKILSGIYAHNSYDGHLFLGEQQMDFNSLKDAEEEGITVIYQELALIEEMTVAENIFLGREPTSMGLINWDAIYHESQKLLEHFHIEIDATTKLGDLGVGQQQLVEIVKALGKQSHILILDEPTAALTEKEVEILLGILKDLRTKGISCIYISHKLDEVFAISDRITILRDGKTITTLDAKNTTKSEVIRHMVGREITNLFPREKPSLGKPLLSVEKLSVTENNKTILKDISFMVREGEILGIGGLMASGRTELLMHIFGAYGIRCNGTVKLGDKELVNHTPETSIAHGLVMVSEDRKVYGLILDKDIGFNISLSSLNFYEKLCLLDTHKEFEANQQLFDALKIKAPNLEEIVENLSGGNQQKVVIAKTLMTKPKIIFLDEPTRGIDVGAKLEVYNLMNELTRSGYGIVMVSSELPELIGMSDRIIMLCEGKIGGEFDNDNISQEHLIAAAIGQN